MQGLNMGLDRAVRAMDPVAIYEDVHNVIQIDPTIEGIRKRRRRNYSDKYTTGPVDPAAVRARISAVTTADVKSAVCNYFDLPPGALESSCRHRTFARPRQIAMYLSRKLTGQSYPQIGRAFGGRDHTTVLFACRKLARLLPEGAYPETREIEAAIRAIKPEVINFDNFREPAAAEKPYQFMAIAARFHSLPAREVVS